MDQECLAANVEENDYTIFTYQDLQFELELVVQSVVKKIAFIDNQVRSSINFDLTELTSTGRRLSLGI
jgi:hypothetical protein